VAATEALAASHMAAPSAKVRACRMVVWHGFLQRPVGAASDGGGHNAW